MDDTDYMSGPIRTSGEAWDKIHDELLTAGIKYRDASEGVEKLREMAEHGSHWYDIIARTRSALEDEAGVAFQAVIADEVRALANERDTAVRDRDEFRAARDELLIGRDHLEQDNRELHEHCNELEKQLTEQASSCYDLRKRIHDLEEQLSAEVWDEDRGWRYARQLEDSLSAEKETVDDLQWKLDEERASHNATKRRQNYLEAVVTGRDNVIRAKDREINRLTDELHEAREEAAAEGMSRRHAENTLAEIRDTVENGPPPSDGKIRGLIIRVYGQHWGVTNADNAPEPSPYADENPRSSSLVEGHHVRVVSSDSGAGHKGERGVVESVSDESIGYPFRVRFEDGDWRDYRRDELERV